MIQLLFVCHGNICRSPMAEFVMKYLAAQSGREKEFTIASAATSTEELGHDIHHGTRRQLVRRGIPFTSRQAVQLQPEDYDRYDLFIGMDEENRREMTRLFGSDPDDKIHLLLEFAGSDRSIADPWYTGRFEDTFEDILEGCTALLEHT